MRKKKSEAPKRCTVWVYADQTYTFCHCTGVVWFSEGQPAVKFLDGDGKQRISCGFPYSVAEE